MDEIETFIRNYSFEDREFIVFDAVGGKGPTLHDSNRELRLAVFNRLKSTDITPPAVLIRELYDAETSWSEAAWCVHHEFISYLATQLLRRGDETDVGHYLKCVTRSQDAYFSSLCVTLQHDERSKAVEAIDRMIPVGGLASERWKSIRNQLARDPNVP